MEDKLLIWRFNRGDLEAVRRIYEKYKRDLLALAASLLMGKTAAEDVVHDVFVALLRIDRFRLTGSLKGFLATCVANAARNAVRTNIRHRQNPLENVLPIESNAGRPENEAIFGEESRRLSRAISELPYEQREVVLLHIQGGLKFAEIAESQHVSINTVQGRYRYGLEKLRSLMNSEVQK